MKPASIRVTAVRTELFRAGENLSEFVIRSLESHPPQEGWMIAITSKIISLAENRITPHASISKKDLVVREADVYLGEIGFGCHLTIKHGLLIPSAGIDESNSESGDYILYPEDPFAAACDLHHAVRSHFGLKQLGILITDSHTTPLRRGVTGIALAYWGVQGVRSMVGHQDLFGRPIQMTQMNLVDGLAAAAVLVMGETDERCPLAIIEGASLEFVEETNPDEVKIALEDDLYQPLLAKSYQASSTGKPS